MCLTKVNRTFKVRSKKPKSKRAGVVRYKFMYFEDGFAQLPFFLHRDKDLVRRGRWLTAEAPTIRADDGKEYRAGWHVYMRDNHFNRVKVRVSGPLAKGVQSCRFVSVYKYLYVPKEGEKI